MFGKNEIWCQLFSQYMWKPLVRCVLRQDGPEVCVNPQRAVGMWEWVSTVPQRRQGLRWCRGSPSTCLARLPETQGDVPNLLGSGAPPAPRCPLPFSTASYISLSSSSHFLSCLPFILLPSKSCSSSCLIAEFGRTCLTLFWTPGGVFRFWFLNLGKALLRPKVLLHPSYLLLEENIPRTSKKTTSLPHSGRTRSK